MTPAETIREIDARLLLAGARLARYRDHGAGNSLIVQRGVIDRLLDERLVVMAARDRGAA